MNHNMVFGFTTRRGLMLDLDNTTLTEATQIANKYMKRFGLQGYVIMRSSVNNYQVVFNRYMTWRHTLSCLFKIVWRYHFHEHNIHPGLTNWAMLQACNGLMTLRISWKKRKKPPKVIKVVGKTDKLIFDYLKTRQEVEKINSEKEPLIERLERKELEREYWR